jgi:hypothetical protein
MNTHLHNEGQECKTDLFRERVVIGGGGWIESENVGETRWCSLCTYMNKEHWIQSYHFNGGRVMKENDGGDKPNQVTL